MRQRKAIGRVFTIASVPLFLFLLIGCQKADTNTPAAFVGSAEEALSTLPTPEPVGVGIDGESAKDANVNFPALKEENGDIVAWLDLPHTQIDAPVLQSTKENLFYEGHDAHGKESTSGALYIGQANVSDFCDFMTVIYGKGGEDGPFRELYRFSDPDFFEEADTFYLYLDGNLLTYTVFASCEEEERSLLRDYDFTSERGCEEFLSDLYGKRSMGMLLREGWEEGTLSPYHFLVALTARDGEKEGRQFTVFGCLTRDAAGTIDRVFEEAGEESWDPAILFE